MAQDNVDVIQTAWDAFVRGDIDKATSVADPNAEFVAPASVPWGGTYHGPEGFRELLASIVGNFDKFEAKPEKVLGADDDHVVVVAKYTRPDQGRGGHRGRGGLALQDAQRPGRARRRLHRHRAAARSARIAAAAFASPS